MKLYSKMLNLISFCLLIIFVVQNITGLIAQSGCTNEYVTLGNVTYIGCKESVSTDSLENPPSSACDVYSFKAIPYAKPPVGDLRFRNPEPLTYSVPTTIDCTEYGKSCIQPPFDNYLDKYFMQSENCLFLNIWTKSLKNSSNLPVMVYIHGGGFYWGSSRDSDGTQLALRDVVYVNMNYRLGAFGFFCTNSNESTGNQGLYDQNLVLKWVVQYIKAFGGNPDNITLFGHSAGSMSVSYHIISEKSNSLFNKAILQSGAGMVNLFSRSLQYSDAQARRFASSPLLWVDASKPGPCYGNRDEIIYCLRKKSALDIFLAQTLAITYNPSEPWYSTYLLAFMPCYGDAFIPQAMNESFKAGKFQSNLTVIIGHTEMEGALFTQIFDLLRFLGLRYQFNDTFTALGCNNQLNLGTPSIKKTAIQNDIAKHFFDNKTNSIDVDVAQKYTESFKNDIIIFGVNISADPSLTTSNRERYRIRGAATHAFGDYALTCPTILFGYYLVKSSSFFGKVYQYRFTYGTQKSPCYGSCWCNATHYDDVRTVLGFPYMTRKDYSETDRNFSTKIMKIWTDFAKNGDPGNVNGNVWPTYTNYSNGDINLTYIELHPDSNRFGRIFTDAYDGINEYTPKVIMNCKNYWNKIISDQFGFH